MSMHLDSIALLSIALMMSINVNLVAGEAERPLFGQWTLESREINGLTEARYSEAAVEIRDSADMTVSFKNGQVETIKFSPKIHDEKQKVYQVFIESPEDSPELGGDGARKGICRINAKGELEILEAKSASHGFPVDFSDESKAKAICWKLKKAKF